MKLKKHIRGMSVIIFVLLLAGILLALFTSVGNSFYKLNKTGSNLREYSETLNVAFDMGPMINNAYQKAVATSSTIPPACDADSEAVNVGTFYMCFPRANFCSQFNATYCLAKPYTVSEYKNDGSEPMNVVLLQKSLPTERRWPSWAWLVSPQMAKAQAPPETWLPDVSISPPVQSIQVPTCADTSGVNIGCIRCDGPAKNAHCLRVRFCRNASPTCLSSTQWIEPIFAIQTNYGP